MYLPLRIPATAFPAVVPGIQISTSASARGSMRERSTGRPLAISTTTGLPVALTLASSSSWTAGSAIDEREQFSPLQRVFSPRQRIVTSDFSARATASERSGSEADSKSQPFAETTSAEEPNSDFIPFRIDTTSAALPRATQLPMSSDCVSARGPMRAMRPFFCRGNREPSFFRRTIDSWASSSAFARAEG